MIENFKKLKRQEAAEAAALSHQALIDYNIMMGNLENPQEDSNNE